MEGSGVKLEDWGTIADECETVGLLVGNGASRNVSRRFDYSSLYEIACSEDAEARLDDVDQRFFTDLHSTNFERVLGALATARVVNERLEIDCDELNERYSTIRSALVEAVRNHHVEWSLVEAEVRHRIQEALLQYDFVYSTNYDLLIYWAVMADGEGEGFRDYFWSEWEGFRTAFDRGNIKPYEDDTMVLYLHGGLHLCRSSSGKVLKRARTSVSTTLRPTRSALQICRSKMSDHCRVDNARVLNGCRGSVATPGRGVRSE